jgi:poly-gamma-glutamate synthesis protein (capsule biosynthesis protein)
MNNEAINIFISGDFAPRMRVNEVIERGDYQLLYNDILPIIQDSDFAITNLESPLLEEGKPIAKTGPNLKSPIKSIEALKFAGFDMVTLANNHMMDFGEEGLFSTIQVCERNNIRHIGAGLNIEEAKKVEYFDIKGNRIAFINCCENEWSTTQGDYPGCNPLNEVALYYQIQDAKVNADYIILIIHGGHETYEFPSLRMKKLYRWFIDLGVDAVIGHHTHCFSGYEIYGEKPIVYSLGNFVFDSNKRNSSWNVGAAVTLTIQREQTSIQLFPFKQCDDEAGVKLFNSKETDIWLEKEAQKSEQIQDDTILEKKFEEFAAKKRNLYRGFLEPNNSSWVLAAKNKGLLPRKIKGDKRLLYWNIIRAEAHRDILLNLLSKEK